MRTRRKMNLINVRVSRNFYAELLYDKKLKYINQSL